MPQVDPTHQHWASQIITDNTHSPISPGGSVSVTDGTTTVAAATGLSLPPGSLRAIGDGTAAMGFARVVAFPFAHRTPGLSGGVVAYVPVVGDVLLDAWFQVDTAWDGTTPLADFGNLKTTYTGGDGWFAAACHSPLSMQYAEYTAGEVATGQILRTLSEADVLYNATAVLTVSGGAIVFGSPVDGASVLPLRFLSVDPVKVWVTQDGSAGGADPASTQGAATLFLVVASPA